MRSYFMKSDRIGFSKWTLDDIGIAKQLWGDHKVTKFICVQGKFNQEEILQRLQTEITNDIQFQVQYWPMFDLVNEKFLGCCGLRPVSSEDKAYELGCHLRKECWWKGYATEACATVVKYCFNEYEADVLYAGHHPQNNASRNVLMKLGFHYIGTRFYEPTGLYHPSYEMKREDLA